MAVDSIHWLASNVARANMAMMNSTSRDVRFCSIACFILVSLLDLFAGVLAPSNARRGSPLLHQRFRRPRSGPECMGTNNLGNVLKQAPEHQCGPRHSVRIEFVLIINLRCRVLLALQEIAVSGGENIDLRAHEAAECILRRANNRLAAHIEAG